MENKKTTPVKRKTSATKNKETNVKETKNVNINNNETQSYNNGCCCKNAIIPHKLIAFLLVIITALSIALGIILIASVSLANHYENSLESVYQKSFMDLVDDVNNAEINLSKILSTDDELFIRDLLLEVAKNTNSAQNNLSVLPVSVNGLDQSIKFINQVNGYTETLAKKLIQGGSLTPEELETLQLIYNSILKMKQALNKMQMEMGHDYSIVKESLNIVSDYNDFTIQLQSIKTNDVEYPTMIYDGPFADSQIKKEVKGLNKSAIITEEQAKQVVAYLFEIDVKDVKSQGEAISNFETYNFVFKSKNGGDSYAQISKAEGKLITLANYKDKQENNLDIYEAMEIASNFIKRNGVENMECVWFDAVGGNAYFNFAPVVNNIIYYPDLIKVKCDLYDGEILGYEARSYYTNHTERTLPEFKITVEEAQQKVKEAFVIEKISKALAPIDYKEILCYEFACSLQNEVYYFYINGVTGTVENILKVIYTEDGSKLM